MKTNTALSTNINRILSSASIIIASSLLVSCGNEENKQEKPAEVATTQAPAVSAEATPAAATEKAPAASSTNTPSAKDLLVEQLLYVNQNLMSDYAANPVFTETIRETLALMQDYYDSDEAAKGSLERYQLAQAIAKACLKLKAYARAEASYKTALADYESLSAEDQDSIQQKLSNLYNGYASCLLLQAGKQELAKEYYDKQLQLDKQLYSAVQANASGELPAGVEIKEMQDAAGNLASSYRCKGDCLIATDELEEARDVYKLGIGVIQGVKPISPNIAFEFVELLTSLGNLESRCGNLDKSVSAWKNALGICEQVNKQSKIDVDKLRSKTYYDRLKPLVEEGLKQLQAEEAEAESLSDSIPSIDEVTTPSPAADAQ